MFKRQLIAVLSATALLSACGSGTTTPDATSNGASSIVQTAEKDANLSTLVAVLKFASDNNDLVNLLSNPGTLTVFAPSNAAFDALAIDLTGSTSAKAGDLLTAANKPLLRTVLQYHVLTSVVKASAIPFGKAIEPAAPDTFFKIDGTAQPLITDGRNRVTRITATDIAASNGVVHLVDKVLLPADKSIAKTAIDSAPEFTSLVAALTFASDNGDLVNTLSGAGKFTVFAPTNAAFDALAKELTNNANAKAADILIPSNKALIKQVLQYHVLSSRVLKADVPTGTAIATLVAGKTFTVSPALAITDGRNRTANIVKTDVLTNNGVIHAIDKVILPAL
jgi:uncharacterized surface protein with fasciclin (FAS1) repeats